MPQKFASLFNEKPTGWGLRGDPFLWDEMSEHLAGVVVPKTDEGIALAIGEAFEVLTGASIRGDNPISVARYPSEGMSGGFVSPSYWREDVVALLCSRRDSMVPSVRDYFAELYVAGIFGDDGWSVYFPKRDVGFDFIVSKQIGETTLLRPVQVKGLYPTIGKKDRFAYGYTGRLTGLHTDMVLVLAYFSARVRGVAPECIAYMPQSSVRKRSNGQFRCVPAVLVQGSTRARPSYAGFFGEEGLRALSQPNWGRVPHEDSTPEQ